MTRVSGRGVTLSKPVVSLIVPALNEADSAKALVGLFHEIKTSYEDYDFELVFVDDGSSDGTAELVLDSLNEDDVARVTSLSRNFGSHAAISAGLELARGDCALTLGADLQEPLEAVGRFLAMWRDGYDVVWGLRSTRSMRKGPSYAMALLFSHLLSKHSEIPTYPPEGPAQILVSRAVIDAVKSLPERNRNVFGLVAWAGYRQGTLFFEQLPRHASTSKWTFSKKVKLALDSFTEFSSVPIRFAWLFGIVVAVAGALTLCLALVLAVVAPDAAIAWVTIGGVVLLVSGVQLVTLGLLGEYLWRAGYDAKQRPLYLVRTATDVGPVTRMHE
jgi:polyisoprenyl-phosphate glycosyltransferase